VVALTTRIRAIMWPTLAAAAAGGMDVPVSGTGRNSAYLCATSANHAALGILNQQVTRGCPSRGWDEVKHQRATRICCALGGVTMTPWNAHSAD